jgi:fructose-specific component phosphotransferase system IIB-like protein
MFGLFTRSKPVDEMRRAVVAFEKVASLKGDSREAKSLRLRMGMICRAHLDKTFIAGAEQTAVWEELARAALLEGSPLPEAPKASKFQKIRAGDTDIYAYLPEEFVTEAFALGARYQKTELSAPKAIEAMQALAHQISYYELRLQEPFQVLDFLREELAAEAALQEAAEALPGSAHPPEGATPP